MYKRDRFSSFYLLLCRKNDIFAQNMPNFYQVTSKTIMEVQRYNRIKVVLAEKEKTGTWLSEQMGKNIGTVSRWMTNKVQPSVEQLYDIAQHLDVDVKDLLLSSKDVIRNSSQSGIV